MNIYHIYHIYPNPYPNPYSNPHQAGFYDYGPMGVELKNNIKRIWWRDMVQKRDDVVGLDSSIISSPLIWQASGHVGGFSGVGG